MPSSDRSGAAVSSSELDRLKREYSQGRFNTESELLNAMQRYKRGLQAKMQDIEAANPRAAAQYAEQGGTTSRALAKRTAQAPGGSGASGGWGPDEAHASEPPKGGYRKAGAPVSRDEVAQYAMRHGMKESDAREYLKGQGYAVD